MKPKEAEFKPGDVVYLAESRYLNQWHQEYQHFANEQLLFLRVRIMRTVIKEVLPWMKGAAFPYYRCLHDQKYPEFKLYGTIYDALDSLPVGEAMLYVWKGAVPFEMSKMKFNISTPIEWYHEVPLEEVHATMGA